MKTLSQLKMSEFIDVVCGKLSLIWEGGESFTKEEAKRHVEHLIVEYKSIVNPSGMKAIISQEKQKTVRSARIYILKICVSLLMFDDLDKVRDILSELGWKCGGEEKDDLSNRIQSELRRLEFEQKRSSATDSDKKDPPTEHEMRSMFDKEQAALMTFYKMPFTMDSVTASVYANMVAQAEREIAIRKNTLKNR